MKKFIFLGGDERMLYTAAKLGQKYHCTFNGSDIYDYAVLPPQKSPDGISIPGSDTGYMALGTLLKTGAVVFTGNVCDELEQVCRNYGFTVINYLEREELAIENAVLTAEGALEIALRCLPVSIYGTTAVITGYGRIAKILAGYIHSLGGEVIIACRKKSDRKWAEIRGFKTADITDIAAFSKACSASQLIFNTVPAPVFTDIAADSIKEKTLYIELASTNGIDLEKACERHIETVIARGLPGKTSPVTAGQLIAKAIENILAERGDNLET